MERTLAALGIRITGRTAKDQTTSKERWSISLTHPDLEAPTSTKVELAYRSAEWLSYVVIESVPMSVMAHYSHILPPMIGRYTPPIATYQKIYALKERGERSKGNQERDIFDLDLLFRGWPAAATRGLVPFDIAKLAADRASEMSWPNYRSKVVSFLEPVVRAAYDDQGVWNQMLERVIDKLLELAS